MFYCDICHKNFTRKEHLERHTRSHKDERPYICCFCGKGFGRKDLLTRHIKSDTCMKHNQSSLLENSSKSQAAQKKAPRCQSACQHCITSKCRCVKSNIDGDSCDRCLKRGIPCISKKTKERNSGDFTKKSLPDPVDKEGEEDNEYVMGAETLMEISNSRINVNNEQTTKETTITPEFSEAGLITNSVDPNEHDKSRNINKPVSATSLLSVSAILSPVETHLERQNNSLDKGENQESVQGKSFSKLTATSAFPKSNQFPNGLSENHDKETSDFPRETNSYAQSQDTRGENTSVPLGIQIINQGDSIPENSNNMKDTLQEQRQLQENINPLNITLAFSYFSTIPVSYTSSNLELVNKFDFDGVLNSIRNILQAVDEKSDSISEILDNWIYDQNVNYNDDCTLEDFFNLNELESYTTDNVPLLEENNNNDSHSPIEPSKTSRGDRGSVFSNSSIVWKTPHQDSSSKDLKPFAGPADKLFDFLGDTVDQKLFKKLEVYPTTRDSILIALSEIGRNNIWRDDIVVNLPPVDKLTILVINYFKYFQARYQIIHMPSFNPNSIPIVLLIAILGAGSFFCGIEDETMKNMGRYLLEISRRRLLIEYEVNNSKIRETEIHQASLINYICGSWSGIDRNVEISASFTSTITTMIRRGELFKRYTYKTLQSIVEDPEYETTESKWQAWVKMESKKMLVFIMYFWSCQFSLIYNNPYYITYAELELPLPHLESLWNASTADEWYNRVTIVKRKNLQHYSQNMSFQQLIGSVLSSIYSQANTDSPKYIPYTTIGSLISTVKSFISEFNDRLSLANFSPGIIHSKKRKRHSLSLDATFQYSYLTKRKSEIENMLESLENYISKHSYNEQIVFKLEIEYSFICLYSCVKDCMKFAGVDGEYESRQTLPRLIQWFKREASRVAIWHCAQILDLANSSVIHKICK